ncbi:MAG: mechanosensitive ion channel family protein [Gemmatimonadota bacterium]
MLGPFLLWVEANPVWGTGLALALLLILGEAVHRVVRLYLLRVLEKLARKSPTPWDQTFFDHQVPQRLAFGVPLFIWYAGIPLIPGVPPTVEVVARRVFLALLVVVAVRAFSAFLGVVNTLYLSRPRATDRPIKGYLQVASVLAHLAAFIWVIAILMDRSPVIFLSGLGAMTAVLLLVFRDTLLSLVAGVQITSNDLIRVGDWIEMPQFSADGDVIDIALNTVRVQNWDRTITAIPTHKFLEHSFRNWRGMQDSGGRRIKRAFRIDMNTIRFLMPEEEERFGRMELLREYIHQKREELAGDPGKEVGPDGVRPHRRRLTNVGTLRAYIVAYLRAHPGIHQDMTFLVRQLEPTPEGLPLEIYVFSNDTRWAVYEGIQADIFDHILATTPDFGLRVFQSPSGQDVTRAILALTPPGDHTLSEG